MFECNQTQQDKTGSSKSVETTHARWQANEMTPEHTGDRLQPIDTGDSGGACGARQSETGARLWPVELADKSEANRQEQASRSKQQEPAKSSPDRRLHQPAGAVQSFASRLVLFVGHLLCALLFRLLAKRRNSARPIEQAELFGGVDASLPATSVIDANSDSYNNKDQKMAAESSAKRLRGDPEVVMVNVRGLVAGFEEQVIAKELSSQVVDEALAFVARMQRTSDLQLEESQAREQHRIVRRAMSEQEMETSRVNEFAGLSPAEPLEQLECSQDEPEVRQHHQGEEQRNGDDQEGQQEDGKAEEDADDEDRISVSSSYEEFCGQQASEMNLRRLKMDALEDLVVCGQSREATESARRLFSRLSSAEPEQSTPVLKRRGADSLSSRSSGRGEELEDDDQDEELMAALSRHEQLTEHHNSNNNNSIEQIIKEIYSSGEQQDDYGTIKIARRKFCQSACSDCSAGSSSGRPHSSSYGSTLVCALSPSRDSQAGSEHAGEQSPSPSDNLSSYPIDGEEIRQCRAAFRENRRLIEHAQALAFERMQQQPAEPSSGVGHLSRRSSQVALMVDRSHWSDSLQRRAQLPECSRCRQKVYPLDRLELDFTRAKLNIHRNCFKCQVCHTLLRLETYASIDTKLFCPAHTKLAAPVLAK